MTNSTCGHACKLNLTNIGGGGGGRNLFVNPAF